MWVTLNPFQTDHKYQFGRSTITRMENEQDGRYNQAVADILRARKEDMGITFDDLSAAADLPRATVARIIYGQREIRIHALRRIAKVLELDPADVLAEAEAAL